MSSQKFLSTEDVLTILLSEAPQGVYAEDRADDPDVTKRSYSSAELRAFATLLAQAYSNLSVINSDKFLTTVTQDGLSNWEKELFSQAQNSNLSYQARQQNLIAKRRAIGGISLPAIQSVVAGILSPTGLSFQILPYSGQSNGTDTGAWVLSYSQLGSGTYLAGVDPNVAQAENKWLTNAQNTAYTYEVRIFGQADASTLMILDQQLTALEPARSTHIITNNASQTVNPTTYEWNTNYLYWWKS